MAKIAKHRDPTRVNRNTSDCGSLASMESDSATKGNHKKHQKENHHASSTSRVAGHGLTTGSIAAITQHTDLGAGCVIHGKWGLQYQGAESNDSAVLDVCSSW